MRGEHPVPVAAEALELVIAAGLPYTMVTNNGMEAEGPRAERLSKSLGVEGLTGDRMVMCHTALAEVDQNIKDGFVLVTGFTRTDIKEIMRMHGFHNVATIAEFVSHHPHLVPNRPHPPPCAIPPGQVPLGERRVGCVIILETPVDWHEDLQVICDLVQSDGHVGTLAPPGEQPVKLICCNFDFTFPTSHARPRLGPGAFYELLEYVFKKQRGGGQELECIRHGKPYPPTYVCAKHLLQKQLKEGHELSRVYCVGDNPPSDVRGARMAGPPFKSILVRTGAWQSTAENDVDDPADYVCENVLEAVKKVFELEGCKDLEDIAHVRAKRLKATT
eukprot:jgi/Mesvir1/24874/Mv22106-RA.2